MVTVRTLPGADLDPATLYALLRLRVDVFVVEQACPYPELDGRDLEPTTRHCWIEDDGVPVASARILDEGGTIRIGRVATAASHRRQGLAATLIQHALERARLDGSQVVLHAQSHLVDWYRSFGFDVDGPEFVEDGIPHTPMRLSRR